MVEAIMPSKWGPWSSMNHSDSAKKFFAEMMFHAAKQEPPKSRFLAFSHLRVRGVFFENSRGGCIPHPRVKKLKRHEFRFWQASKSSEEYEFNFLQA